MIDVAGPGVLVGERVRRELEAGMAMLADLLRRTLGPSTGIVLSQREGRGPEAITSAGVLARRMIAGSRRPESVGMMLLRHGVWRVHEETGEGGATTAALIHSLVSGGLRLIAAGADPLALRRGMERGLASALTALRAQALPLTDVEALIRTSAPDPEVAAALIAIFGELGLEAGVEVEEYAGRVVGHHIVAGSRWAGKAVSSEFSGPPGQDTILEEPYVLVVNQPLSGAEQIVPLLERVIEEGGGPLLVVAPEVTGTARSTLLRYRTSGVLEVVACRPTHDGHMREELQDIAAVTGAQLLSDELGRRIKEATSDALGYARGVRIGPDWVEIAVGAGDANEIEARRRTLRARLAGSREEAERALLVRRIANLAGRTGVLELGASTDSERALRRDQAERTARVVPVALEEGVLPGGAASLLHCRGALEPEATAGDERAGIELVGVALQAPTAWLIRNAGQEPGPILAEIRRRGPGHGYDVVAGEVADMRRAGIVDVAKVMRLALESAVSTAASALTAEALVLRRDPPISVNP